MLTTVLLDLDGTLLDSNDAHAEAWLESLQKSKSVGLHAPVTFADVRPLIGMGADQLLPALLKISHDDPLIEEISAQRSEIFKKRYLSSLRPFPGARELVETLQREGLKVVVATSASGEDVKGLLTQIGIEDLIQYFTTADDAKRSKPHPDILLEALKKSEAQPAQAVMVGDTVYDIKAAQKLVIPTIALTCGGCSAVELKEAIEIYSTPKDLLRHYKTSILTLGRP